MIGWMAYRGARGASRDFGKTMGQIARAPAAVKFRVIAWAIAGAVGIQTSSWGWFVGLLVIWVVIEVCVTSPEPKTPTIGDSPMPARRRRAR